MAKIGIIHYNFPGFSLDDFLKFSASTGCEYVELQIDDVWGEQITNPEVEANRLRRQMESLGLKTSALAAYNDFVQLDPITIEHQVTRMNRVADLARILGTDIIRAEGGAAKAGVPQEKWYEAMYGCFMRCLGFLHEKKVSLAIDNHGPITNDGDQLLALLKKIGDKQIGTNLDTMNYRWFGLDLPTCNRLYSELAPHVLHTHIKNGIGCRRDYRGTLPEEGEIDLNHALACLKQAGYDGVYCVEYEGLELAEGAGYRKCCEWMKAKLA